MKKLNIILTSILLFLSINLCPHFDNSTSGVEFTAFVNYTKIYLIINSPTHDFSIENQPFSLSLFQPIFETLLNKDLLSLSIQKYKIRTNLLPIKYQSTLIPSLDLFTTL